MNAALITAVVSEVNEPVGMLATCALTRIAFAFVFVFASAHALAQSTAWPARPVRVIVPFPPGGSTMESVVRLLTQDMPKSLGRDLHRAGLYRFQQALCENSRAVGHLQGW